MRAGDGMTWLAEASWSPASASAWWRTTQRLKDLGYIERIRGARGDLKLGFRLVANPKLSTPAERAQESREVARLELRILHGDTSPALRAEWERRTRALDRARTRAVTETTREDEEEDSG